MAIRLKLKEALDGSGITVYRLGEASGVPRNTLYNLVNQQRERLDLEVLDKVISGLEQITGRRVELTDLLEREPLEERPTQSWLELAGTFDDPTSPGDIAARHDDYLSDALLEEHREGLEGKR